MRRLLFVSILIGGAAASQAAGWPGVERIAVEFGQATGQGFVVQSARNADARLVPVPEKLKVVTLDHRRRPDRGRPRETTRVVPCYSHANRQERCETGMSQIWNVSVQQISRARCRRDDSWWMEGTTIVVDDGCRADFTVTGYN